ncbi:hypothetical protein Lal_00041555 [Lupinus albus]|nr:hypothetical protein Lal_00041555 [Lupinus albus]
MVYQDSNISVKVHHTRKSGPLWITNNNLKKIATEFGFHVRHKWQHKQFLLILLVVDFPLDPEPKEATFPLSEGETNPTSEELIHFYLSE